MRQTIFTIGYPKSGTTYLTRLLGDILNSPTGGCMPELDHTEVATEGQNRPGDYIIRKGHFTLIKDDSLLTVPYPHKLNWQRITNEKIVFIVRDPRDICVSGAYHWQQDVSAFLDRMIKGDIAKCGRWDEYVNKCLLFSFRELSLEMTLQYEDITKATLVPLCYFIGSEISINRIDNAIKRQSFQTRKQQIWVKHRAWRPTDTDTVEQELRRNNMRKGIVGDWHNHFTQEMNDRIWSEFGWIMEKLGYSK